MTELPERFKRRYVVRPDTGCWEWTASTRLGYGRFWYQGRDLGAHRVSYEILIGPIPDGMVIDHLCRNTKCVNPAHLEPVTPGENTRRGVGRGTGLEQSCPQGHPYDERNTYHRPDGGRNCRACNASRMRRLGSTRRAESL